MPPVSRPLCPVPDPRIPFLYPDPHFRLARRQQLHRDFPPRLPPPAFHYLPPHDGDLHPPQRVPLPVQQLLQEFDGRNDGAAVDLREDERVASEGEQPRFVVCLAAGEQEGGVDVVGEEAACPDRVARRGGFEPGREGEGVGEYLEAELGGEGKEG